MAKQPKTPAEWQEAVDLADAYLHLDAARGYGLVTGGPTVDVERCTELLAAGRARGVEPTDVGVDRAINAIVAGGSAAAPQ